METSKILDFRGECILRKRENLTKEEAIFLQYKCQMDLNIKE